MIKGEHLHSDIEIIKKTGEELALEGKKYEAAVLKALTLELKLLLNIRQNQTRIMEAQGIKLIVPKGKSGSQEEGK